MKSIFENKMLGLSESYSLLPSNNNYIDENLNLDNFSIDKQVQLIRKYAIQEGVDFDSISNESIKYILENDLYDNDAGRSSGNSVLRGFNSIRNRVSNFINGARSENNNYKMQRRLADLESRRQDMEMQNNFMNAYMKNPSQFRSANQYARDADTLMKLRANGVMSAPESKLYNQETNRFNKFYGINNGAVGNTNQWQMPQQNTDGDIQVASQAAQSVNSDSANAETPETKQQIRQIAKIIKDTGEKSTKRDLLAMQTGLKHASDYVDAFITQRNKKIAKQKADRLSRANKASASVKGTTVNNNKITQQSATTKRNAKTRVKNGNGKTMPAKKSTRKNTVNVVSQPMHDYSQGATSGKKMREVTGDIVQNSFDYRQMLKNRMPLRESFARRVPLRHNLAHSYFERRMGL